MIEKDEVKKDTIEQIYDEEETPGFILKNARLRARLSIEDISRQLRLKSHYIESIEGNNFTPFKRAVFIIGYLRSYAKLLGLAPQEVIAAYERIQQIEHHNNIVDQEEDSSEKTPKSDRIIWSFSAGILLVILLVGIWWQHQKKLSVELTEENSPIPEATQAATPELVLPKELIEGT